MHVSQPEVSIQHFKFQLLSKVRHKESQIQRFHYDSTERRSAYMYIHNSVMWKNNNTAKL